MLTAINKKGPNSAVNVFQVSGRLKNVTNSKVSDWQIIDACRNSKMVDVVDKNHIRRKMPFVDEEDKKENATPAPKVSELRCHK